jgi:RNA polymerase sigma-70 factor (ECF subfamily)
MATEPNLDAAMDRYARGDDRAFAEVFSTLRPRLLAFLRRLGGSPELAEDLLQETFLRIHRARGSFGSGAAAAPWAYAIARNCFVDHYRSRRGKREVQMPMDADDRPIDPVAGPDASAEEAAIAAQLAGLVQRELAKMTVARREAFVLMRYEGLSVAETARIVGATEGAVKLRAFHAYQAIRKAIDAARGEEGSEA